MVDWPIHTYDTWVVSKRNRLFIRKRKICVDTISLNAYSWLMKQMMKRVPKYRGEFLSGYFNINQIWGAADTFLKEPEMCY